MIQDELNNIEKELKKRFSKPYHWGRKQNDEWDRLSNFIYETSEYDLLLNKIDEVIKKSGFNREYFFNYASNRWYNFWSSVAVEKIFSELPGVTPAYNSRNRLVDFKLFEREFDHKTSVFPQAFSRKLEYARQNPEELINWLYKNQSAQQRQHFSNRLFLVAYASNGEHWKVKAEIFFLKKVIEEYMANYKESQLLKFEFNPGIITFSDIIWAVK